MTDNGAILKALKNVSYPGFSKDIVSLDAVESVTFDDDGRIIVDLKKVSAEPQTLDSLEQSVKEATASVANGSEVIVLFGGKPNVSDSCGSQGHSSDEPLFKRDRLAGVKHIIPVVSGKGGVGKSTVSVNLAAALLAKGNRVGLLDLDLFGPSLHRMIGVGDAKLMMQENRMVPHEQWGLKVVSIGMALGDDEALIVRGPMVMKILNQFLNDVEWGDLDYLIVDMPPGTGDIPLSLAQQLHVTGAVIVTTPQDIALIDVRRAITMFKKTETPLLGVVENMSYYKCEKCGDVAHLFGQGGGEREAAKAGLPLFGQIPLTKSICERAESGSPIVDKATSPEVAAAFESIAARVAAAVEQA